MILFHADALHFVFINLNQHGLDQYLENQFW